MSDATNLKFSMRAEKTTRNKDDVRVLIAGTLFCIMILLVQKPIFWIHDAFFAERPMISATVEVKRVPGRIRPMINYDADARQNVRGSWIATVYAADESGGRLFSRRGDGSYSALGTKDEPRLWTWSSFFDNEKDDYVMPEVPTEPFIVCVRYDVYATDSNYDELTENDCSEPFDPSILEN